MLQNLTTSVMYISGLLTVYIYKKNFEYFKDCAHYSTKLVNQADKSTLIIYKSLEILFSTIDIIVTSQFQLCLRTILSISKKKCKKS